MPSRTFRYSQEAIRMPFCEGETIIHPFHGPLRVTRIAERTVGGHAATYLNLVTLDHKLTISVPIDRAGDTRLRKIASHERVQTILDLLRAPSVVSPLSWTRRISDFRERLNTGHIDELCYVIREISRTGSKAPASAEGKMLRTARTTLATELGLALKIDRRDAEKIIDSAAKGSGGSTTMIA
ncbi:CarD family transcriptional regulator [Rhodococcus erythropolis]|uniref:CarD family transcriptional regulator n=1 Tax=Rhodococcus erythropolis TaxID=1833 RepID=UPI0012D45631|nr:CarD family transcriptional regulator [Rhodococcus erythropolis]